MMNTQVVEEKEKNKEIHTYMLQVWIPIIIQSQSGMQ